MSTLAVIAELRGSKDEAERDYRQALAIRLKSLGAEHPDTARTEWDLAVLLHKLGRNAEARLLLERAAPVFELRLGPEHDSTKGAKKLLASLPS